MSLPAHIDLHTVATTTVLESTAYRFSTKFCIILYTWQSIKILQIQNGGRPPYWKSSFGYISTIYCPINVKLDVKKQNYVQITVTWPKYQNLKILDGGKQPFWKWFHHYISAADHPISMKFGVPLHSLVPRTVDIKVSKFCKLKMADGRFVSERLYVGLQISWVIWVNRRCPPMLIVIQG